MTTIDYKKVMEEVEEKLHESYSYPSDETELFLNDLRFKVQVCINNLQDIKTQLEKI